MKGKALAGSGGRLQRKKREKRNGMFTLTPTPFDRLTALSLSKGSPLKGEGD